MGSIETMSMEDYELTMNINVKSAILLTQYSLPYLVKERGSIVNVSSVTGTRSFPGVLSYCMSKAALDQFTKCTALGMTLNLFSNYNWKYTIIEIIELAEKGVRVNSVNPGVIVTNIHRRAGQTEEQYAKVKIKIKFCYYLLNALSYPGPIYFYHSFQQIVFMKNRPIN